MKVLYTCDNNYIWLMGISIISLFENNREMGELDVYLLGEGITYDNRKILDEVANKYNRTIMVIDVPEFNIPKSIISERWPLAAFIRLFSGELLPTEIKRVLYLDCDTIITGTLDELDEWNMEGKCFCGVKDCVGASYKKNIGMHSDDCYVNAGVLLIDLEKLRFVNVKEVIDDYMAKYKGVISYADQDILNGVFNKDIGYIPPKFNVMTIDVAHTFDEIDLLRQPTGFYAKDELEEAISDSRIIHYTTNMLVVRPWYKNSNHPLKAEFEKYMDMSPWGNNEKQEMQFGKEADIIRIITYLPDKVAYMLLGMIHAQIKPKYIKLKSIIK